MNEKLKDAVLSILRVKALSIGEIRNTRHLQDYFTLIDIYKEPFFKIDTNTISDLVYLPDSNCLLYNLTELHYNDSDGYWHPVGSTKATKVLDAFYGYDWFILPKDSELNMLLPYIHTHDADGKRR